MTNSYCVIPHYDTNVPTKILGWCVIERTARADNHMGYYPTQTEAKAVCQRMAAQAQVEKKVA